METAFVCNMGALSPDQRERYKELVNRLVTSRRSVKELPDGYGLEFEADSQLIRDAAEFVDYERLCCPFFDFTLMVERDNRAVWLELRGREGVKDFIRSEFSL